jgi:hypothetical protein
MQCPRCGQENPPQAKFCGKCGEAILAPPTAPPPPPPIAPAPGVPPRTGGIAAGPTPTGKLIYPSNPPQSPHLAWVNLLIPGLSQILMGQTTKGIVLLVGSYVLLFIGIGALVWIGSVVDGFMVGQVLQSGRPVGEWQFFPS